MVRRVRQAAKSIGYLPDATARQLRLGGRRQVVFAVDDIGNPNYVQMLRAIEASGRRNYSLFLREDGLLIGYYETDDDEASQRALEADPRTAAWEADMAPFFVALDGARPDQGAPRIPEVFHLEDQLARLA